MPATPSGGGVGGPEGSAGAAWDALTNILGRYSTAQDKATKASEKQTDELRDQQDALRDQATLLKAELSILDETSQAYKDKQKEIVGNVKATNDLNKRTRDHIKDLREEKTALDETKKARERLTTSIKEAGTVIAGAVSAHHSYNIQLQDAIDRSGRSGLALKTSTTAFENLRKSLNLTRKSALEFSNVWADASRLGATNQQLERMVGNLTKVHGQAKGMAMAKDLMAAPLSKSTWKGVRGGDAKSIAAALRVSTAEQGQAILSSTVRTPGSRTEGAQQAVRFEAAQTKVEKFKDDITAEMQSWIAAGIGPEVAALITPLLDIKAGIDKIAFNTGPLSRIASSLASRVMGAAASGAAGAASGAAAGAAGGAASGAAAGGMGAAAKALMGKIPWGGLLKGSLAMAAGQAAGWGFDTLADQQEKGSFAQKGLNAAGSLSRVGGWAAGGAMVGGVPGAVIGGGIGAAVEWGPDIVEGIKTGTNYFLREFVTGSNYFVTKAEEALKPEDTGKQVFSEVMNRWKVSNDTAMQTMANLTAELEKLPTSIAGALAARPLEVGKASIDTTNLYEAAGKTRESSAGKMDKILEDFTQQIKEQETNRQIDLNELLGSKQRTPELEKQAAALRESYDTTIGTLKVGMQDAMKNTDMGGSARAIMESMDTRRGQLSTEKEAAEVKFKRTGELTGKREDTLEYEKSVNEFFEKDAEVMEDRISNARKMLDLADEDLMKRMDLNQGDAAVMKSLQVEGENLQNQRLEMERNYKLKKETFELSKLEAKLAVEQKKISEYERTAVFKRAQQDQALATARLSLTKERGGKPEEIGAQATAAGQAAIAQFSKYQEEAQANIDRMTANMNRATAGGNEGEAIKWEKMIADYRLEGLKYEAAAVQGRKSMATEEEGYRQEQIGAQKHILEVQRDSAAKLGASWRVQMRYQSDIIRLSKDDLVSSQTQLAKMGENLREQGIVPTENLEYLKKQGEVTQKSAALQEAIMGKQRSFLEQALGVGFGMGGGTKIQPNINTAAIFGEVVQGPGGMKQSGQPLTMGEQRRLMMRSAGSEIRGGFGGGGFGGGGIGGVDGNGGGGGGGFRSVAPNAPGGGGPGASNNGGRGMDVSGQIQIAVNLNSAMFETEVKKIIRTSVKAGALG